MSSRGPPLFPESTNAGIIVNPHTLERVIPATKRPDGSIRKEIKIRPGFVPAEDIATFRSQRAAQRERNVLPKGAVVGYTPPPDAASSPKPTPKPTSAAGDALSKAAAKNAKRAEKRKEKRKVDQADFIRQQFDRDAPSESKDGDKPQPSDDVDALADKLKDASVS